MPWPWRRSKHRRAADASRTPPTPDIQSPEHPPARWPQAGPPALQGIVNTAGPVTAASTGHARATMKSAPPNFIIAQSKGTAGSDPSRMRHLSSSKKHEASSGPSAQAGKINPPPDQTDKISGDIGRVRRISSPKIIGASSKHSSQDPRSSPIAEQTGEITSNKPGGPHTTPPLEAALPRPNAPHPTPSLFNGTARPRYMSLPTAVGPPVRTRTSEGQPGLITGLIAGQPDKVTPNNPRSRHVSLFDIQKKTSRQNAQAALPSFATERLDDPSSGHSHVHHMSLPEGRAVQSTPEDRSSLVVMQSSADPRDNSSGHDTSSSPQSALPGQNTHTPFPRPKPRGPIERIRNRLLSIGRRAPVSAA